jgi:hypothetical protein
VSWFGDLRFLALFKRAVVAWETMASIMKQRWDEEKLEKEKRKPRQAEFGTLNLDEVNRNYRIQQSAKMIDGDDEGDA